jgi:hypothetical protein
MSQSLLEILSQQDEMEAWALYSAQARAGLLQEPAIRIPVGTKINRAAQLGIVDDCNGRVMPRYVAGDVAYTVMEVIGTRIIGGCMKNNRFEPRERVYDCLVDEEKQVTLSEDLAMKIFSPSAEPKLIAERGTKVPISINGVRKEALHISYAGRRDGIPYEFARNVYGSIRHLKAYEAAYVLHFGKVLAGAVDETGLAALLASPCRTVVQVNCEWGYPLVSLRLCDESLKPQLTTIGTGFIDNDHKALLVYSKFYNQLVIGGSFTLGDGKWHIVTAMRVGQGGKEFRVWREDCLTAWIPAAAIEERLGAVAHA